MALSASDKREIEVLIRKEIKDFVGSNTMKQFEEKMITLIANEVKRGKVNSEVKEVVIKIFTEFYEYMWTQRATWSPRLRRA
ncbi:MAG: hypothetical protein RLZ10_836 [Bacteroidota bacterium]|jgi:hypothetical protein